ncbi:hypothetical protein H072_2318 [Dactylellina haptotyla CBS 200.50]|uniref:Major facilitator superfamily (MFS) profile domain-containing protein n=1 Tax=Dactylellina haptotyla (strain CBS 200.50) TaxID=1284197 RepID=S8ARP0_DACHA|nr:hypothetical protein H072_2318 [Dactylellina haptotyla CBS 200.50]
MDPRDERTPLLQQRARSGSDTDSDTISDPPADVLIDSETGAQSPANTTRKAAIIISLFVIIVFVFDLGNAFFQAPIVRIYEDIICRKYYDIHQPELHPAGKAIPEDQCKIPPVQQELALIRGMEPVFDAIPGLLVAIPLGMIADNPKIGRKPVIIAALLGSMCQITWVVIVARFPDIFPLRLVWLGSIFLLAGGTNMINGLIASTFFTLQLVGSWLPVLIAPPITSSLMEHAGNWVPASMGLILDFLGFLVLLFLPETIHFQESESQTTPVDQAEQRNRPATVESDTQSETVSTASTSTSQKLWSGFKSKMLEFAESSSFVFQSPHLIILICSLMMHAICLIRGMETLLYYASVRYGITIAKANLLNTVNAAVSIGVLFFLPFVSSYLTNKLGFSPQRKDLLIAQVSVTLFGIGWYTVGLAPTLPISIAGLVIYTLGSGFSGSVRSLAASYVQSHHQARLSSFIAIMMTVGNFVGSPMLAWLYSLGVSTGNPFWYGLPFVGLGVVFTIIGSALWFVVKLPEQGEPIIADEVEDEPTL